MTTKVEKSVVVEVPLSAVYNQWTQFEEFPRFMGGVESVTQLSDDRLQWVAEMGGVQRQWIARILEQVPDRKVAWAAVEGATNAGSVTFTGVSPDRTEVHLRLEFEPEGFVEKVGDLFKVVENQAEHDLENFKRFIEDEGYASGAWRGSINRGASVEPGIDDAALSRGDSGRVGDHGRRDGVLAGSEVVEDDLIDDTATGDSPEAAAPGVFTDEPGLTMDDDPDRAPGVTRRDDDFGGGTARLS